jgi:hypothetical protein
MARLTRVIGRVSDLVDAAELGRGLDQRSQRRARGDIDRLRDHLETVEFE